MPPNEIDDIWMSDKSLTNEVYHGHIFLIGLQKLRVLGKLSGFKISDIKYVRLSKGSLFLFPFFYPMILLRSFSTYLINIRKHRNHTAEKSRRDVYKEQLLINIKHILSSYNTLNNG